MIKNFETAPFPPFAPLVGKSLAEGKRIIGGNSLAPDSLVLWLRQGGRCFYCDEPTIDFKRIGNEPFPERAFTIDHVHTRRHHGERGRILVGACHRCNQLRHTTPAGDFIVMTAFRLGLLAGLPPLDGARA